MFTPYQSHILLILSESPETEYYLSELGGMLGKHPGVFQRGVNSLEKQGWILSRKRGAQRLFKINAKHPLFEEIKAFVRKTVGIETQLKKVVNGIDGIKGALIYGSYARGRMRQDSDIDLLVVVDDLKAEDKLVNDLSTVEKALGREVNYKLYDESDFKQRRKHKDPFLKEVLSSTYINLKGVL